MLFKAEAKLRLWAEIYPNCYIIGIFACCRQLYDHSTMTGCISKETAENIRINGFESLEALPEHLACFRKELEDFQQKQRTFKDQLAKYKENQREL